jgi:hypothetical protein
MQKDSNMAPIATYAELANSVRGVLGDWEAAANHLRKLGWTVADWKMWANECQAGSSASPGIGLRSVFQANADFLGLAPSLRGCDDDVATCLACLWLWVSLDHFVSQGQAKVLDKLVVSLAPAQSSAA